MKPTFCSKCGSEIPSDSLYCTSCGEKINNSMIDEFTNNSIQQNQLEKKGTNKKRSNRQLSMKKEFVLFLICLIMGLLTIYLIIVVGVRISISKMGMKEYIHKQIIENSFMNGVKVFDQLEVSKNELDFFEEFGAITYSEIASYLLSGDETINSDKVLNWLNKNKSKFRHYTGMDYDKKTIKDDLEESAEDLYWELQEEEEFRLFITIIGKKAMILITIIYLLNMLIVGIIFGKRIDKTLVYIGTLIILYSIISLILLVFLYYYFKDEATTRTELFGLFTISKSVISGSLFLVLGNISVICGKCIKNKKQSV